MRYLGVRRPPDRMVRVDLFDIVKINGGWYAVRPGEAMPND